jgi:uncharacterized protein YjbI with pentapeptide repeats
LEEATCLEANFEGADLSHSRLGKADLTQANLNNTKLISAHIKATRLSRASLQQAALNDADLDGADLSLANLEGANLVQSRLTGANLFAARLSGADLAGSNLQGANLSEAQLGGIMLADDTRLPAANLRSAILDVRTRLSDVSLGTPELGFVSVADTAWNGVNLSVINWGPLLTNQAMLGDEQVAREENMDGPPKNLDDKIDDYQSAVRANRQLAVALQAQGLNEPAEHFAYRALTMQRTLYVMQNRYRSALFSGLLDVVAGYGYKLENCVRAYFVTQVSFISLYLLARLAGHYALTHSLNVQINSLPLAFLEATILSITSFHGRAFLPGGFTAAATSFTSLAYGVIAAIEAVVGLVIEAIFVAVLVQRYFR